MQTIDYLIIMVGLVLIASTISDAIVSGLRVISEKIPCKEETLDALQKCITALEEKLDMHSHMPTIVSK